MSDSQMSELRQTPTVVVVAALKPNKENPLVEAGANVVAAGIFAPSREDVK
jgi:hypothetical protein